MTDPTLVVLHVSPWSERARWAFDHHRLPYRRVDHQPVLGELRLRRLVGRRDGPATVPVLVDGELRLFDSWDIARHADDRGAGPKLFPAAHLPAIQRWNDLADAAMSQARCLVVAGMLADPAAMDESMPPAVPAWLRRLARPINRAGTQWFGRKYGVDLASTAAAVARVRETLATLRDELAGRPHLLGDFTYADIVASTLLQGVAPVSDEYIRLGPATRRVWTQPELAAEFPDLVRWRDQLYRDHRRPA